jgi:hypothetical protein
MMHIHGLDRGQLLLLPEAIDDYVAADNPIRFIDAFVEGLDSRVAGFERVEPKATGRPGYAPGDLLKLCVVRCRRTGRREISGSERARKRGKGRAGLEVEPGIMSIALPAPRSC